MQPTRLLGAVRRLTQKDDQSSWRGHLRQLRTLAAWHRALQEAERTLPPGNGPFTAILLSYARPQNIEPLARSLLRTPSVGRVIVSNHHPDVRLGQWIDLADPRLSVRESAVRLSCAHRYRIALQEMEREGTKYFLCLDDDMFLLPTQLEMLCQHALNDPLSPHGIHGQHAIAEGSAFHGTHSCEKQVDLLNRVYAFRAEHVRTFHTLVGQLGRTHDAHWWTLNHWDDLVLSFSGSRKPRIHDVGPYVDCPTSGRTGTAVWKETDFTELRGALYPQLCTLRPLPA